MKKTRGKTESISFTIWNRAGADIANSFTFPNLFLLSSRRTDTRSEEGIPVFQRICISLEMLSLEHRLSDSQTISQMPRLDGDLNSQI